MDTQLQPLKGFRDFTPIETFARNWLKAKLVSIFESWGYEAIETPTLEPMSLFAGQIGEDEKLFYSFTDNGDRHVALRYDQTVPTARFIGRFSHELIFPFRRYQIQPVFRAEKPQAGRYREFIQCDADMFGITSPLADAELIALGLDIMRQLGFPQAIAHINDRSLFADLPSTVISSIDKLDKLGPDGVIKDLIAKGISESQAQEYLNQITQLVPNSTIHSILDYLQSSGFDSSWYQFDPTIARAFSYSQGPIWEIKVPSYPHGTLIGGERYDNLINKITNQNISGTGFGLGFDRTLDAAIAHNLIPVYHPATKVLIIPTDSSVFTFAQTITHNLRTQGVNSELYPDPDTKVGKALRYASRRNLPFAILIGPDELQNQTISLKDLASGQQQTIPIDQFNLSYLEK